MIEPSVVNKLKTYNNSSFNILSVYLGADTVEAPSGEYLLTQLHSLIHQQLTKEDRATFASDIARIEKYLEEYIPSARSVVFFSAGDDVWEVANLTFPLPVSIRIDTSPDLDALLQALQKYLKYLVLLIDREKALMFTVDQGEIADRSEFIGGEPVPQRTASTGRIDPGQTDTNFRYNELLLRRHIELAVEAVVKFVKNEDIHFVVIGGHKEMFKKVIKLLPADLQKKVVGSFVSELNIPLTEILHESQKVAGQVE